MPFPYKEIHRKDGFCPAGVARRGVGTIRLRSEEAAQVTDEEPAALIRASPEA